MTNRQSRKEIAEETLAIIEAGGYVNDESEFVDFSSTLLQAVENTRVWKPEELTEVLKAYQTQPKAEKITKFEVTAESTFQAAHRLIVGENSDRVCVLNFASGKNPGGGFLNGSQAQEEALTRSSVLYNCLTTSGSAYYQANREARAPFYTHSMIWSPNVPVFRNDVTNELLPKFYTVNVITAPAVNAAAAQKLGRGTQEEISQVQIERVGRLMALALNQGVKTFVLGAWGCGVFGHKAEDMAKYFSHYLKPDGLFSNSFERITFAVHYTKDPANVDAFQQQFGS